jgi:ubiquinone/menaquinone biosynthesis C-methylase UbiE
MPSEERAVQSEELERRLEQAIDPWLQHMRWRSDFAKWREDRLWQEKRQTDHLELVRAAIDDPTSKRFLDVGCGMGGFVTALQQRGVKAFGLDYNLDYCRITNLRGQRYGLDIEAIQGEGEQLPYRDASFDALTCWDILEHVQKPEMVLAEIRRVLKPGGEAFVTVVNRFAARDPHYHLYWVNWMPRSLGEHYAGRRHRTKTNPRFHDRQALAEMHYYTYRGFRRLARAHGLRVTDLLEERVRQRQSRRRGLAGRALRLLQVIGLAVPAYRIHRFLWRGTYHLRLEQA